MHNAAFRALGLNHSYLAFDVHPDHLTAALEGARRMQFLGLNLTVPHKMMALEQVDLLDATAKRWGAVNTILHEGLAEDDAWRPLREFAEEPPRDIRSHGFNTDAHGLTASLCEDLGLSLEGLRVVVLGAGGAGRVAALQLADRGVRALFLVNRTMEKADALGAEIRQRTPAVQVVAGYPDHPVDLIVNATSLGLKAGDPLPLDVDRFPLGNTRAVYDMVYRPAETPFLARAREEGARGVNGLGMLLHQGAKAFELWTGKAAPLQVMRTALHEEVYGH
jgi:shikimate dehydrogenase